MLLDEVPSAGSDNYGVPTLPAQGPDSTDNDRVLEDPAVTADVVAFSVATARKRFPGQAEKAQQLAREMVTSVMNAVRHAFHDFVV